MPCFIALTTSNIYTVYCLMTVFLNTPKPRIAKIARKSLPTCAKLCFFVTPTNKFGEVTVIIGICLFVHRISQKSYWHIWWLEKGWVSVDVFSTVCQHEGVYLSLLILYPNHHRSGALKIKCSVCLSLCLSVACLDLTRERKGLGSPKLTSHE